MKRKCFCILFAFIFVLFLASPLFSALVGANALSSEEIAELREKYPEKPTLHALANYVAPFSFSREANDADDILYGKVLQSNPTQRYTVHTVYVLDTARGTIKAGQKIEVVERFGYEFSYITKGDCFVAPVWEWADDENRRQMYPNSMFYVTDDGYVLSVFDESDQFVNYDLKIHSGMTVQALLRKYIAKDGVPAAGAFETIDEIRAWLARYRYDPYG